MFLAVTIGKTINNVLGKIYEQISWLGSIANHYQYKKSSQVYIRKLNELKSQVFTDLELLSKNIGSELWIENPELMIRPTLWNEKNKKALQININTASIYEIASFWDKNLAKAKLFVEKRNDISFFESFDEAAQYGYVFNRNGK